MEQPYNDNTPMPFGEYKGRKLANVPANRLIWYYNNYENLDPKLKQYIEDNMNMLTAGAIFDKNRG